MEKKSSFDVFELFDFESSGSGNVPGTPTPPIVTKPKSPITYRFGGRVSSPSIIPDSNPRPKPVPTAPKSVVFPEADTSASTKSFGPSPSTSVNVKRGRGRPRGVSKTTNDAPIKISTSTTAKTDRKSTESKTVEVAEDLADDELQIQKKRKREETDTEGRERSPEVQCWRPKGSDDERSDLDDWRVGDDDVHPVSPNPKSPGRLSTTSIRSERSVEIEGGRQEKSSGGRSRSRSIASIGPERSVEIEGRRQEKVQSFKSPEGRSTSSIGKEVAVIGEFDTPPRKKQEAKKAQIRSAFEDVTAHEDFFNLKQQQSLERAAIYKKYTSFDAGTMQTTMKSIQKLLSNHEKNCGTFDKMGESLLKSMKTVSQEMNDIEKQAADIADEIANEYEKMNEKLEHIKVKYEEKLENQMQTVRKVWNNWYEEQTTDVTSAVSDMAHAMYSFAGLI